MSRLGSRRPQRVSEPNGSNGDLRPSRPEPASAVIEVEKRSAVNARPPTPAQRLADLQTQLGEARDAMARQRQEFDEDASSFAQAIARLSHSERTLGHTKAKLMSAEARAEKAEAEAAALSIRVTELESAAREQPAPFEGKSLAEHERAIRQACEGLESELELKNAEITRLHGVVDAALAREVEQAQSLDSVTRECAAVRSELEAALEQTSLAVDREAALRDLAEALSRDSAAGAAECAKIREQQMAAEDRERVALVEAADARDAHTASLAELGELRQRRDELLARSAELEHALDHASASMVALKTTIAERDAALALALGEMASVEQERSRFVSVFSTLETLAREIAEIGFQARTEAERGAVPARTANEPITLRPEATQTNMPRGVRTSTAPEILIDGVRLGR